MKVSTLSKRNLQELSVILKMLEKKTNEHKYVDVLKVLFEMKKEFEGDDEFYPVILELISQTTEMFRDFMSKK